MAGPRQLSIKDREMGNSYTFRKEKKGISLEYFSARDETLVLLSDAKVRKLRNWLNWYLDNK